MRTLGAICIALLTTWFFAGSAIAGKRVALVIGNSAYKNVPRLQNPRNDAAAMAAMFQRAGFDAVDSKLDLDVNDMRRALREFGVKTRDADVAVIYYAGHGIELDGNNYLIPVDATLETDTDVLDETFALDRVLVAAEPAKQLRLIIIDACRDNPFAKTMKRTLGSRAVGRGLAKVEPSSPNTMIAFAAKAGSTASDGDTNSPFAKALVNHLSEPGLDLRKAFGFVRDDVLKATHNVQEPFIYGSLGGNDVSLVPAEAAAPVVDKDSSMRRDYELALQIATRPVWDSFILRYPTGFYTELAKAQRDRLAAEAATLEATAKAKAAQEEQTRLAVEGAKASDLAKAAEQTKTAEKARIAAELAKKAEEAKVAEAERVKSAELSRETELAKAGEQAKAASAAKAATDNPAKEETLAALAPAPVPDKTNQTIDVPRSLQSELKRVGCTADKIDGSWNLPSQRALGLFNRYAGTNLDVKIASIDALDVVKSKTARVCPLVCDHGFKADDDHCTKIICRGGYELGDGDTCLKVEVKRPAKPLGKRNESPTADERTVPKVEPKTQGSGQIVCARTGCRTIRSGCHLGYGSAGGGAGGGTYAIEVCP